MSYKYLASPYSHEDPKVREQRYLIAQRCLRWLLVGRTWTYSPIVHCHDMAVRFEMPTEFEFWKGYNDTMLTMSSGIILLKIDGWEASRGMNDETTMAEMMGLSIRSIFVNENGDFRME